jgi:hypothetical protein
MPADGLLTAISFGGVGTPPLAASYQYTPCAVCVEGMLGSEGGEVRGIGGNFRAGTVGGVWGRWSTA